jgi:NADH-quinone oxidoreductase subunit L
MGDFVFLIPFMPLLGFILNGLWGKRFTEKTIGIIGCSAVGISFVISLFYFFSLCGMSAEQRLITDSVYTWIKAGDLKINMSFQIDPLSVIMILVVSGVGFLIHVYSVGYMHGDRGFYRYFAYLNLFTFSMLTLVLASNFVLMFVGWEGVGLCSYLLIGFWFEKKSASDAGKKAFIVNRIGDFGFLTGMALLFWSLVSNGIWSFEFNEIAANVHVLGSTTITLICLLLFVGATGKSAQIPLYVWLPDAMEGPTPVSALIHAATMVTAGVYMVARCSFLFSLSVTASTVVAAVGVITALFAATIGLAQNDIKRVLAYSTVSQLGYMFVAVGVGAYVAGIFHLMTHAFFKALLFLGAGSVMHALSGEQDMRKMGGLRQKIPVTYKTILIATLAIAGVPGLSGFFSKDEILWKASGLELEGFGNLAIWFIGAITAGITAFYMFRLVSMTFYGEMRVDKSIIHKIHESPKTMTIPLIILAVFSIIGGFVGVPQVIGDVFGIEHSNQFHEFLAPCLYTPSGSHSLMVEGLENTASAVSHKSQEWLLMFVSVIVALAGIYFAVNKYAKKPFIARQDKEFKGAHRIVYNKYFVDELYDYILVRPFMFLSEFFFWKAVDVNIIDRIVNGVANFFRGIGKGLRRMQTGFVQNYAFSFVVGVILVIGLLIVSGIHR